MKPEFRCDCSKCLSIRTPINNFYATNKPNRFNWNQLTTDKIYAHIMINYMERGYYRGIACNPPSDLFERPRCDLIKLAKHWYDSNNKWMNNNSFPTSQIAKPVKNSKIGEYTIVKTSLGPF